MRFSEFLVERAKIPMHSGFVKYELNQLKSKLWDKNLEIGEILDILNKTFSKFLIRFEETYSNANSDYSAVGLDGGSFSASGWITVNLMSDANEFFNGDTRSYYSEFVDLCSALIGHELTHRDQVLKSLKNFDNAPDTDDMVKYLKDHRELESYAVQAALELLSHFSKKEILSKLSSSRELDKLSAWSEAIKWYTHTFETSDPTFKKFLKKIVEIITEED
jgi:tRNA isopentenyl-2-thiomethyl-A-37 hydroxylase MiaE